MATKSNLTLRIDSVASGGDGVARSDGKVCFVVGAAPGDLVEVAVTKENKNFKRCEVVSIIEAGKARVKPKCQYFETCGGCEWQHVGYDAQIDAKQSILSRALGLDDVDVVRSPQEFGYRQTARLHGDSNTGCFGFMRREKNVVVDVARCEVLDETLNQALLPLKEILLQSIQGRFEVRLMASKLGPAISIEGLSNISAKLYSQIPKLESQGFVGVIASCQGVVTKLAGQDLVSTIGGDGGELKEPVTSFGQANRGVDVSLGQTVASWLEEKRYKSALELFSGSGNLSMAISPHVKKLATVELDERACQAARFNVKERKLKGVSVHCGDAENLYKRLGSKVQLVVLDPPRTGHLGLAREIAAGNHRAVLYVSCNPATLSRDIKELTAKGFKLSKAKGFDMFPQTSHIEAAALLEKKNGSAF